MSLDQHSELFELLEALCEATITSEQFVRLQTLIRSDPRAQALYVEYMTFSADLKKTLPAHSDDVLSPEISFNGR